MYPEVPRGAATRASREMSPHPPKENWTFLICVPGQRHPQDNGCQSNLKAAFAKALVSVFLLCQEQRHIWGDCHSSVKAEGLSR